MSYQLDVIEGDEPPTGESWCLKSAIAAEISGMVRKRKPLIDHLHTNTVTFAAVCDSQRGISYRKARAIALDIITLLEKLNETNFEFDADNFFPRLARDAVTNYSDIVERNAFEDLIERC